MKTPKTKSKTNILSAVHETAAGLHKSGLISKRKMANYDALCLKEIPSTLHARLKP